MLLILNICLESSVPVGFDDPNGKSTIEEIVVSLYNGASFSSIARGQKTPEANVVISANFPLIDERCLYITLMLQFLISNLIE